MPPSFLCSLPRIGSGLFYGPAVGPRRISTRSRCTDKKVDAVADLVFAFDPAIDRPLPRLESAPAAASEPVATAATDALLSAAAAARQADAKALVLFGRILDPHRASPAQAALLRSLITGLAAHGCRTVWLAADATACNDVSRMLGEPAGLVFVTPVASLTLEIRGITVEIVSASDRHTALAAALTTPADAAHDHLSTLERRIVVGWDASHWNSERWDDESVRMEHRSAEHRSAEHHWTSGGGPHMASFGVWGSRRRPPLPPGMIHLPALQARSAHEAAAGSCGMLTLLDHPTVDDGSHSGTRRDILESRTDWRHNWREVPTNHVGWQTITIASATGGDEELATTIWSALEGLAHDPQGPLQIIRCHVECGTSVARRVRVAEISAETLARVRQLFDARTFRAWCHEVVADPGESLVALGHSRSGAKPGSTTSFSTALADIVNGLEQQPLQGVPADLARESAWLALELIEST